MTFFITILSISAYLFYRNTSVDLHQLDHYSGQIIDKGITKGSTGSFYLRLNGLNQILATYSMNQDYSYLNDGLAIGDRIEVYYGVSRITDKPVLNLYQVEKNGKIILDKSEHSAKDMNGFYVCVFGVFMMAVIGILKDRKYWKSTRMKRKATQ